MNPERADYGIDAPRVVRNLFVLGGLGLSAWGIAFASSRFGGVYIPQAMLGFIGMAFGTGILCILMGVWMVWESKIGKIRRRERLLRDIDWTGAERVLDAGCGRGLLLIGAAKRLTTGKATGIDVWQAEDLSGNRPEVTLENARKEGVADRVDVQTADIRQIPYADASFDVVVSQAVIHNLYKKEDRAQAVREISRVLKPGGRAVIDDIRHHGQYTRIFLQNGCTDVRLVRSLMPYLFFTLATFGSLRPASLVVRKPGAPKARDSGG